MSKLTIPSNDLVKIYSKAGALDAFSYISNNPDQFLDHLINPRIYYIICDWYILRYNL